MDRVQEIPDYNFKTLINDNDEENDTPYNIGHSCEYFEEDQFIDKVKNMSQQISVFSNNIRSLPGKWESFNDLISTLNNYSGR